MDLPLSPLSSHRERHCHFSRQNWLSASLRLPLVSAPQHRFKLMLLPLVRLPPMTDTAPTTIGTPFAPEALVPVLVGCTTVNLYPIVDHTMMVHEHAYAFQINKTALTSQALNLRIMLDVLGAQLNLSTSVKGMFKERWFFQDSWFDFQLLQILSFHN